MSEVTNLYPIPSPGFIYRIAVLIGCLSCRAVQFLNNIWVLVVWLFLFNFLEGFAVNGLANAGLPSIERQFQLTSTKSSLIPASQDIGALSLTLFISFFGARTNKISWIAAGSVMMAVGSVIFIIPHIAEEYNYAGKGRYMYDPICARTV